MPTTKRLQLVFRFAKEARRPRTPAGRRRGLTLDELVSAALRKRDRSTRAGCRHDLGASNEDQHLASRRCVLFDWLMTVDLNAVPISVMRRLAAPSVLTSCDSASAGNTESSLGIFSATSSLGISTATSTRAFDLIVAVRGAYKRGTAGPRQVIAGVPDRTDIGVHAHNAAKPVEPHRG